MMRVWDKVGEAGMERQWHIEESEQNNVTF